jgi:hypothetical protein
MDISKFDKADVLRLLYNNAKPLGMGFLDDTPEDMTKAQAQELLDAGQTNFDYLYGRAMKIDLSGDELRTDLYNRDNGQYAAECALLCLMPK